MVVADKREFESFAPFNRIRNRRASDDKTAVLDAWESFEFFELPDEGRLVLCRHFRLELEENYDPVACQLWKALAAEALTDVYESHCCKSPPFFF